MANKKHLDLLQQGYKEWNIWRERHWKVLIDLSCADLIGANLMNADLNRADLSGANLIGANLIGADLSGADLRKADLSSAKLIGADLEDADLSDTNLIGADLNDANLRQASFIGADLSDADFRSAKLNGANFRNADFSRANLSSTNLYNANFNRVTVGWTQFGALDLRTVKGLETIRHIGPSYISTSTLEKSHGDIPDIFLRNAGLNNALIAYTRSLIGRSIEYYTCFISYSSKDQCLAERLYTDLQSSGVRCWFAPENLKGGDKFADRIEASILAYDKFLILLSNHSIVSSWVENEVRAAFEKEERFQLEQQLERTVLFPIKLDNAIEQATPQWAAQLRRQRHMLDFTGWKNENDYLKAFGRLLCDLKADATTELC